MFKEFLSWPVTMTIQTRVCTGQIILLCWTCVPCDNQEKEIFLLIFACDLALGLMYILSAGYVAHLHSDMKIERRVRP